VGNITPVSSPREQTLMAVIITPIIQGTPTITP
jgi:hypothetical protein